METNVNVSKTIIFDNKNSEDYWLEQPFREEYYRSEIDLNHYLRLKKAEKELNNDESIDYFVHEYLKRNGETSRDLAIFIKELQTFLKMRNKQ